MTTSLRNNWSHPDHYAHSRYRAAWNRRLGLALYILYWFVSIELFYTEEDKLDVIFFTLVGPPFGVIALLALSLLVFEILPGTLRWLNGR